MTATVNVLDLSKSFDSNDLANMAKEDESSNSFAKTLKFSTDMRLTTPKPVLHIGASTEFQRQVSAMPRTPFKPGTGYSRAGTGFKPTTNFKKPGTGKPGTAAFRPPTGLENVTRPMTAVRGAGYTSGGGKPFDPLNQAGAVQQTPPLELQKDDSPEEKMRQQEIKIMQLVEESCIAQSEGDLRKALTKAKEASNKERSLIKTQEQSDLSDHHNIDLTYVVLFNLANQYAANELYTEALNTYQMMTKNRMFANAHRLKVNMGNVYLKQGQYHMAVKMYRMALDQVPSTQKNLRIKIMHNIAMVFVKMGQWEEAVNSLEFIMSEQACHRAGLHLVACCRALEDRDRMRTAFSMLLTVPLDIEDDDKYHLEQDNPEDALLALAIKDDDLHKYEVQKRHDAEYCILTAAKLIAPFVEDNFSDGYDWCVSAIKMSEYSPLASDLEINKAVMFLKQNQLSEAVAALKAFEKDSDIALNAATNLCFIYFMQGDYNNALIYGESAEKHASPDANALVNYGACLLAKNHLDHASRCFRKALDLDGTHFEAIFNQGLCLKRQGHYLEALTCFQRFSGSLALLPAVVYQVANLLELVGDVEAAADTYQQLLGLVPTDSKALQKLGELFDNEGDKQQAHHYHVDSFRYYPGNISAIDWLGSYYIEMQVVEKALSYFEKAAIMQPGDPKWNMMVAGCHRRSGNMHKALTLYQEIHRQFPENSECLRFLVRLCSDLGMREAQDYLLELKKLEKSKEVRERVNSSRPASRRSNSGLSSRTGSGFSPVLEHDTSTYSSPSANRNLRSTRTVRHQDSAGSSDSGIGQNNLDYNYADPLGPLPVRPRTGAGKGFDFEDFGNEELGDDLLPE
ncbi:LOW QUALITY PROTEIN: intraflagellar transport protein 88 homolog [Sitophilus oryzae]|uniref:LOW QUALITY PROTEIN: intraflagellar transport protein 88 homolog n=1 Tax=Sitophilus oryzae TaxID=7048 RepID=A0A6J2YSI2_SITOR|nr:LOW QUALITY PROTEIN: intraflagellar transport protein 88 homolog [Sitophilus oryzae]